MIIMASLHSDQAARFLRLLAASSAVLVALLCAAPGLAQETCTSAQCHAGLVAAANVHAATDSCDSCHEALGEPHPQKGKRTFKLTAEPPALCANCHDAIGTKKSVHSPVSEGMCTTCHDPHASKEAKLLTAPASELCASCHADQTSHALLHGPVSAGACASCHLPHESDNAKLLVKAGDDLCFTCHGEVREMLAKKNVHPAIESGCTSCHDPHGAAHPKLLAEAGAALCYQCHDAIAEQVKGPSTHAALDTEKACATCHSPHATDNAKLLVKTEKETCLSCHPKVLDAGMTFLHGPIQEGRCTACHRPHGGTERKLLNASFPAAPYVPYTDKAYELCFNCHQRDLLQYPDTSFATGFRDGERNLHFLHVNNAQKGRSCRLCHTLHGGGNDRLIADSVPFGSWTLPLKFVRTEDGGSCAPGCHKPVTYDRKNPARRPATASPSPTRANGRND